MLNIGNNRECFFDNYLIDEEKTTAEVRLHKPVRRGVLFEMDQPWEGHTHMHSLIYAEGKWRFYYIGNIPAQAVQVLAVSAHSSGRFRYDRLRNRGSDE